MPRHFGTNNTERGFKIFFSVLTAMAAIGLFGYFLYLFFTIAFLSFWLSTLLKAICVVFMVSIAILLKWYIDSLY